MKNVAPVLNPLDNQTITRTLTLTFTTRASDANGDELTYGLSSPPSGATINPSSGLFSWKPMETGTYTVTVVVTDTGGLTDSTNSRISVVEDGGQQIYLPVVIKSE